jgi:hypothetical protein
MKALSSLISSKAKKKAEKNLSPNERALRERVRRRDYALSVVFYIRLTGEWLDRASEAAQDSEAERFCIERAKDFWFMAGWLMGHGNPALMHLVADALEGESPLSKKDEEKLAAYSKAIRAGKRKSERRTVFAPFISEVHEQLPAKRKDTSKRKDAQPLTPKEIKAIHDYGQIGYNHAAIEDIIGKSYKRIDSGDCIAVNENGEAPVAKRTKKEKGNKEAVSRRLKAMGRILSHTPGAPRKLKK